MRIAIIIGAGPAGLTAAYELLQQTDIIPVVLEADGDVGGLSRTVNYKGNRIDIGGHRFFSKSDVVMNWWQQMLPIDTDVTDIDLTYHGQHTHVNHPDNKVTDRENVLLVRERLSRIFFLGRFFNYPLTLTANTIKNLGIMRIGRIGISYMKAQIFPIKKEESLEDFYINRFGKELYHTFFKDYTEKVWGVPVKSISASWGAQRVKGLSLTKTIWHAVIKKKKTTDVSQKDTETSLIERFLYPKYGPGQMWQVTAEKIKAKGGRILFHHKVKKIINNGNRIEAVIAVNSETGEEVKLDGDYFFSSMPVKDLVKGFANPIDTAATDVAENLLYRDFITVGLLLKELKIKNTDGSAVKDNWIYIQEKNVKVGRLQIFNNWSPYMVKDKEHTWIGLEYFCNEGDELWNLPDEKMIALAKEELDSIQIIDKNKVEDAMVLRMPKTYPSYVGAYDQFDVIRNSLDTIENLFLIGRNGMHKYNNQDHSMLTAMQAVTNIKNGVTDKSNIWSINTEEEYHEEK